MLGYSAGNRNPQRQQGTIDTKVLLDRDLIDVFKENGRNKNVSNEVFPDGSNTAAHNAMPGDTFLLNRQYMIRNSTSTGYMQMGIVALNGMNWSDYNSQMEMESNWKWGGICQTEQRLEMTEYGHTDAQNQGSTSFVVGKVTIPWKSTKPVYPGDMVACRLPPGGFHPALDQTYPYIVGTIPRAITAIYEPYVPTELSVQIAGGAAALKLNKAANGIKDIPYQDLYPKAGRNNLSAEQNVAAALKFGIMGIALSVIKSLRRDGIDCNQDPAAIATAAGLFGNDQATNENPTNRAIHDLVLKMADPSDPLRTDAVARFGGDAVLFDALTKDPRDDNMMEHLQAHALQFLFGGITAAQEHSRSGVVGMSCGTANPGEDATILFGFHCK